MNLFTLYQDIKRVYALLEDQLCDCGAHNPMDLDQHMHYCKYKQAVQPIEAEVKP